MCGRSKEPRAVATLSAATLAAATLAAAALALPTGALAHHSIAMFDQAHPVVLTGVVRSYQFISPHTLIQIEVTGTDARPVTWTLEGNSPNSLTWDGWSSKTLRPGDEVRMTVEPLRSGAPGGSWTPRNTTFKDGTPIVAAH